MTSPFYRRSRFTHGLLITAVLLLAAAPVRAQSQRNDQEYTAKIREFTTETFFSTPYVDHLPASETVPTPLDVLGHIAGAADVLTYPKDIYRYMRAVADASPRVEVFSIGTTEEGREMILAVVSSEENIARLQENKDMMAQLADPRVTNEATAERLINNAKPFYWATGAMHSSETGSPEMLMELVYRVAVEETPFIQAIRNNLILMVTPVLEVDGRAKEVDVAMAPRVDPDGDYPSRMVWWGQYVSHDNNRDGIGLSLDLSKNVNKTFFEYHPLVVHDLHESQSHLYVSTGRGPYNAWFDPITINEWQNIAYQEVREMTAMGVPGVFTHDFYDGWAPNYMFTVANGHNAIGRFYETQGAGDGSTRVIRNSAERTWARPNTPLPETVWSIRNNVNMQQSAMLVALNYVATNKEDFLRNFYRKGQRSIEKPENEGPAAYVFPASDPRPALQARLLRLMQEQGVEVQRLTRATTVAGKDYGAGSYVIRMDQPYSRMADMLLDKQYYNPTDPSPYDDTGWTLGPLFNVTTDRVEDMAILQAPMQMVSGNVMPAGSVEGARNAEAYLIHYGGQANLASFRFAHPDLKIQAAEAAFDAGGNHYEAGDFIIPADGNGGDLADVLGQAATQYGFTAQGVNAMPNVAMHAVDAPRVAVMHTWSSTQQEGWLRIGMDEYKIPYDYIALQEIRDNANLKSRWDVIIIGAGAGNGLSMMAGMQGSEPMPYKATDVTPNLGRQDETDDMRGGLELQGILNLDNFLKAGGVLVTVGGSSDLPIHFGLAEGLSIRDTQNLWAPGGVFLSTLADARSPLAYGFDQEFGVYFNGGPVFASGGGGRRGGFGMGGGGGFGRDQEADPGSTTERRTGRGGLNDTDLVQGRPPDMGAAGVEAFQSQQEGGAEAGGRGGYGGFGGGGGTSASRVVARFPSDPTQLLISGGLSGGSEMAGAPAVVDATRGDGHVVMFSFNPFWRGETLGTYGMLFNALLHYQHLDAGS